MERLKLALLRIKALFTRASIESDMDREMRLHLDLLAEEYERGGLSGADARRAASRRFGNLTRIKEIGGDVRGAGILESILRDVRHALRGFRRAPGFATAAVLTLTLGIGATTAIFSVVNGVLIGVKRMFVGHGLVLAGIGGMLGLVAAAGLTRLMSSLLFRTAPLDPATYAAVFILLVLAAALASYIPARRATAVDPGETLRAE